MVNPLLLLVFWTAIVSSEVPCELYDVTTLVRPSKSISASPKGINEVYEIHSRTNAVGLQTNVESLAGKRDPLQKSELTCDFLSAELCTGWTLENFANSTWPLEDPLLNWQKVPGDFSYRRYLQNNNTGEISHTTFWGCSMYKDRGSFHDLKIRFSLRDSLFFGSVAPIDGDFYEGVEVTRSSDGLDLFLKGTLYQLDPSVPRIDSPKKHSPRSPQYDDVNTVFVSRNDCEGKTCLWLNTDSSTGTSRPSDKMKFRYKNEKFRISWKTEYPTEFQVYQVQTPQSKRLMSNTGTVWTPVLSESLERVCLSMRYFLKEGAAVQITVIAISTVNGGSESFLHTTLLEGAHNIQKKQFQLTLPSNLRKAGTAKLKLSFEVRNGSDFFIKSFRQCNSTGGDVIFISPSEKTTRGEILPNIGFSTKCPNQALRSSFKKKCFNGGINVENWCQCLPGFWGDNCENACGPYEFGADCGSVCNPLGPPNCSGIRLAAPGRPLECARGYHGPNCSQECEPGFYGPNCKLVCGFCSRRVCDIFSGKCTGLCRPGYIGDSCQDELAYSDSGPVVTETGFDSAKGFVKFEGPLDLYPVLEIRYSKKEDPYVLEKGQFFSMEHENHFELYGLDPGEKYIAVAIPIHKDGDHGYNFIQTEFATKCYDETYNRIIPKMNGAALFVEWNVTEASTYPCKRIGYALEIQSPALAEPVLIDVYPNATNTTINSVFLREGSLRLRSVYKTHVSSWSDFVSFTQNLVQKWQATSLKVVDLYSQKIVLFWNTSKSSVEDKLECWSSKILCRGKNEVRIEQLVSSREIILDGLTPFTRYSCNLADLGVSVTTKRDVPSLSPNLQISKNSTSSTSFSLSGSIPNWNNCINMNGIFKGIRTELWNGDVLQNISSYHTSPEHLEIVLNKLSPETSYELRFYLLNDVGWNSSLYDAVRFKTKTKAPDAVRDLAVYKRTRSELWLRWMAPEEGADVSKYEIVLSSLGHENETEEIFSSPCPIWPDYLCHRVRGLIADIEYIVTVLPKTRSINYGSPVSTKAATREGEPAAPENVHVVKYTPTSIRLRWEVPVMLNSNPKFFLVTMDQSDESTSIEKPAASLLKNVRISETERFYEQEFADLNPATTYAITVSAGNRGARYTLNANTPPNSPPKPREPTLEIWDGNGTITARGIKELDSTELLSGYLVLLSTNSSENGVFDKYLAESLRRQFGGEFVVVSELPPTLDEEVITLSTEPPKKGKLSLIQNTRLKSGVHYRFAVAAVSDYCGSYSATI